jgi:hypothetical protein
VSCNSSVPFLPDVSWCFPVQDSVDEDSCVEILSSSSGWVSGIGMWAW